MKQQQLKKNCQILINKLQNTNIYDNIKYLLLNWNKQNKSNIQIAVDVFMKITLIIHNLSHQQKDDKFIQYFNRCLQKHAIVPKKNTLSDFTQQPTFQHHKANQSLEKTNEFNQCKNQQKSSNQQIITIQQIKVNALFSRIQSHQQFKSIIKILHLYLKSIISYDQLRTLMSPLFSTDPSLITYLVQNAQDIIQKRRKATIFAPLNQLVDRKYPNLEQVGESYILIPEGYANYSKTWQKSNLEYIMNRKCVSVPLGSQVSFIINKKTDYEQQLFNYQDQRYQIDNALVQIKAVITLLSECQQHPTKLQSALVRRVINELYPNENISNIFIRNPQIARAILLPRITQKKDELCNCKQKFIKICEEIAIKNFYKSLDYRSFYFAKNDKKFNCSIRWDQQIQLRKQQIKENKDIFKQEQIQDRQSLQRGRYFYVNSFDNITKQNFIENKEVQTKFDHKINAVYPKYPQNQILFILNFSDSQILNDVLQIILHYCTRKNLLQLLIFKLMRTDLKKRLKKNPILNYLIQTKQKIANNSQVMQILANINNPSYMANFEVQGYPINEETLLNDNKSFTKVFKDSEDEFMHMIEQDEEPVQIEDEQSPFEGPENGYTFIGTKQVYIFMRFVAVIYQRFQKAKQYSDQLSQSWQKKQQMDIYNFFLTIMIYKLKDRKYFQEYLRKLFCKDAFIFFTLEKMILSAAKTINNITTQSLTYSIINDQTKDYQLGAYDWQKYIFPSITMQLTRLYLQQETLFRFTYQINEKNCYISAWNPPFKQSVLNMIYHDKNEKKQIENTKLENFLNQPINYDKQLYSYKQREILLEEYNAQQITKIKNGKLLLKGQMIILNKQRNVNYQLMKSIKKEIKKIYNSQINN